MANIIDRKTDETTGRDVIIYDDGTRKDAGTGHFLSGPPGKQINSSARGRELRQIAIDNAFISKAQAWAINQGIDVDQATPEEIAKGYLKQRVDIELHALRRYMATTTSRGAEGMYRPLLQVAEDPAVGFTDPYTPDDRLAAAAELLTKFKDLIAQAQPVEVIDGKLT